VPADVQGAPRLFVFSTCERLVEQLKSAPLSEDARAQRRGDLRQVGVAARPRDPERPYGAVTWTAPAAEQNPNDREPDDPRAAHLWRLDRMTHGDGTAPQDARYAPIDVC
jgi:hypothetical protein